MLPLPSQMQYYAIHVWTMQEDEYLNRLRGNVAQGRFFIPKRLLTIRRRGKIKKELFPVFQGYIFVESDNIKNDMETYWIIRRTLGFIRFLPNNIEPLPLPERDLRLLRHFMSFGDYADTSKVTFDENDRIVVLEGPLKGLEGRIIRIDKRKGRAKVSLDLCSTDFKIDLGFQAVRKVTGEKHVEDDTAKPGDGSE